MRPVPRLLRVPAPTWVMRPSIRPRLFKVPLALTTVVSPDITPLALLFTVAPLAVSVLPANSRPLLVSVPVVA